ncbi:MAG: HAD family phosphatase [Sediminibacterium sp.]|nr:HAD family phosphatase [Sediminibacterium sp.]
MNKKIGIAFDLDGTLVDNNKYHIESWQVFYKKRGWQLSNETYNTYFNGKTNKDVLNFIYKKELSAEEITQLTNEKESLYREIYAPFIKPIAGLLPLLESLYQAEIPMVMATSGIPDNIAFLFKHINIKKYFKDIINFTHIKKGKPDPEIYQLAVQKLGIPAQQCIAFEDAISGIQSARSAGLKVIALTTTHQKEALKNVDLIIDNYTQINIQQLYNICD